MRERPLVYLVPPMAAALYAAVCLELPVQLHIIAPIALLLVLAAVFLRKHNRLLNGLAVLSAAALALTGFAAFRDLRVAPIRALDGETQEITATALRDAEVYDTDQRVLLSAETADGRRFRLRCYLPETEPPLQAGDRVRVTVTFYLPDTLGGFDRAAYQASEGCYIAGAYATDEEHNTVKFEVLDSKRDSLRFLPQRIARFCRTAVQNALPEREAGLLTGLLVGGSSNLTDTDKTAFRIAGLSHLVAVSGLHIGFLVGFCTLLFGKRWGTVVSIPLVLLFVPVAGATPSVVRAALMYLTTAGGFLLRRRSGGLNALLMALVVLLIVNPYSIASVGLQLSFTSTLGLILFAGKLQHALEKPFTGAPKLVRKLLAVITSALSCTVCATIFTVPILLTSFGAVSVLSPISNLMTVGVTSLCFVGGFVLCVAAAVCPALVPVIAKLVRPLISYLLWAANTVADLGFGTLHPNNTFGLAALGIVFAALLVGLTVGKRVKWKFVLPCLAVVLTGLCITEVQYQNGRYTVTYLPCGSGQSILLSDTSHAMLIDCGGSSTYQNAARLVREWLRWNGIKKIDTVVLTAVDQGHARNLPELMETVEVGKLLMPANCQERKTNADLLSFVHEHEAQEISEPMTLTNPIAPVKIFPITEGKLAVCIADEVLILHSPTEKQLSAYLEENTLPAAAELVLSANHLSSGESMAQYAEAAGAQHIIIATSSEKGLRSHKGLDVQSTYTDGEIARQFKKE